VEMLTVVRPSAFRSSGKRKRWETQKHGQGGSTSAAAATVQGEKGEASKISSQRHAGTSRRKEGKKRFGWRERQGALEFQRFHRTTERKGSSGFQKGRSVRARTGGINKEVISAPG